MRKQVTFHGSDIEELQTALKILEKYGLDTTAINMRVQQLQLKEKVRAQAALLAVQNEENVSSLEHALQEKISGHILHYADMCLSELFQKSKNTSDTFAFGRLEIKIAETIFIPTYEALLTWITQTPVAMDIERYVIEHHKHPRLPPKRSLFINQVFSGTADEYKKSDHPTESSDEENNRQILCSLPDILVLKWFPGIGYSLRLNPALFQLADAKMKISIRLLEELFAAVCNKEHLRSLSFAEQCARCMQDAHSSWIEGFRYQPDVKDEWLEPAFDCENVPQLCLRQHSWPSTRLSWIGRLATNDFVHQRSEHYRKEHCKADMLIDYQNILNLYPHFFERLGIQ